MSRTGFFIRPDWPHGSVFVCRLRGCGFESHRSNLRYLLLLFLFVIAYFERFFPKLNLVQHEDEVYDEEFVNELKVRNPNMEILVITVLVKLGLFRVIQK